MYKLCYSLLCCGLKCKMISAMLQHDEARCCKLWPGASCVVMQYVRVALHYVLLRCVIVVVLFCVRSFLLYDKMWCGVEQYKLGDG